MPFLLRTHSSGSSPISVFGIIVPRRIAWGFARLWISIVIAGSLLPWSAKVALHASEGDPTQFRHFADVTHRWIHFFAFGSSFLVLSLLGTGRREHIEAAVEVVAIGCIVEVIQYFVYSHRQMFEWWDVRDDAVGVSSAFLLVQIAVLVKDAISSHS
ncbi:MAG: hypothetical protein M3N41_05735 [Acidobacteriota bacterium]|nr:hypothetical protein [Acidobacteriota bacterium]